MSNYRNSDYEEKVIQVSRVSKKTKGGDQMSFSVLMVVGDRKGKVGVGLGKAQDVVSSIRKGAKRAKKSMIEAPIKGSTVPFKMRGKHGAGEVLLKPASEGSGVIAGGPVRAVVEAAGISDISAKILGSDNPASSVYATFDALKKMSRIIKVRGIKLEPKKTELKDKKKGKSKSNKKSQIKKTSSKTSKKQDSKKTKKQPKKSKGEKTAKKQTKKKEDKKGKKEKKEKSDSKKKSKKDKKKDKAKKADKKKSGSSKKPSKKKKSEKKSTKKTSSGKSKKTKKDTKKDKKKDEKKKDTKK